MKKDLITIIKFGFTPAKYFKRSAWLKIERVMEFLVNKGEVVKLNGEVKYGTLNGTHSECDIERWAKMYMDSPLLSHTEAMKKLSKELGLPMNSDRLLTEYMNLNLTNN